jgi:hypothetical protein
MKKLSSILAISLAMAMTLGMTAFAAPSVTTETADVKDTTEDTSTEVTTVSDIVVEEPTLNPTEKAAYETQSADNAKKVSSAQLTEEKKTASGEVVAVKTEPLSAEKTAVIGTVASQAVSKIGNVENPALKGALDIDLSLANGTALDKDTKNAVIGDKIEIAFKVEGFQKTSGKKVLVLHYVDGKWETVPATFLSDGVTIKATFSSLSPIAIYEVDAKDGDDNGGSDGGDDNSGSDGSDASGAATSPTTAETASAAGVIALAAVASAVVASKKIRYNN